MSFIMCLIGIICGVVNLIWAITIVILLCCILSKATFISKILFETENMIREIGRIVEKGEQQ